MIGAGPIYSMAARAPERRPARARAPPALWPIRAGGWWLPSRRSSVLAARAVIRGALLLAHRAHRLAADAAGFARSAVDQAHGLVAAGGAVAGDEVAQGAAAALDRLGQRPADRVGQALVASQRDASRRRRRPDAGAEQALRRIDVAHADDDVAGEQHRLDRTAARARGSMQQRTVEGLGQRL